MTVTNTAIPVLTGTAQQGQTLYTSNGTWTYDLDVLSFAYRWLRCDAAGANCIPIGGATGTGLLLSSADVGHTIRSEVTATESAGTPLPGETGPITISTGGSYLVNVVSPDTTTAVTVTTNQPVTISGSVKNMHGGRNIHVTAGQAQVTVDHCFIYGGGSQATSHRWFEAFNFRTIVISNCTIDNTRGIQLEGGISGSSVLITKCTHLNVQGGIDTGPVGNFVQFREVQNTAIDVSWNEITNQYNLSNPDDIINLFHTSNAHIHDNLLNGQTAPGNPSSSPQGGITIDNIYGPGALCNNNLIEDNQLIRTEPILMWATAGGHDNQILNNRIVDAGFLDDGVTFCNTRGLGIHVLTGGANNRAIGNEVGVVHKGSRTVDWKLEGCPGGDAGEGPNNTHIANPINATDESDEYNAWLAKLAANGITIGA